MSAVAITKAKNQYSLTTNVLEDGYRYRYSGEADTFDQFHSDMFKWVQQSIVNIRLNKTDPWYYLWLQHILNALVTGDYKVISNENVSK